MSHTPWLGVATVLFCGESPYSLSQPPGWKSQYNRYYSQVTHLYFPSPCKHEALIARQAVSPKCGLQSQHIKVCRPVWYIQYIFLYQYIKWPKFESCSLFQCAMEFCYLCYLLSTRHPQSIMSLVHKEKFSGQTVGDISDHTNCAGFIKNRSNKKNMDPICGMWHHTKSYFLHLNERHSNFHKSHHTPI